MPPTVGRPAVFHAAPFGAAAQASSPYAVPRAAAVSGVPAFGVAAPVRVTGPPVVLQVPQAMPMPVHPAPLSVAAPVPGWPAPAHVTGLTSATSNVQLHPAPVVMPTATAIPATARGATVQRLPPTQGIKRQYFNPKSLSIKYKFNGDFTVVGRPLLLNSDPAESTRAHVATGLRVWDGGIVLARYLEHYMPEALAAAARRGHSAGRLRGLELGSGTGVGGITLAMLGQEAILSDIGDVQQAATEANIAQNGAQVSAAGGSVRYETVDWKNLPEREHFGALDMVFAGDVIWHESLVEPFLQALRWAVSGPGAHEILLSHKVRDEESVALFEQSIMGSGLVVERKVPTEPLLGDDGHPEVFVYHMRKQ